MRVRFSRPEILFQSAPGCTSTNCVSDAKVQPSTFQKTTRPNTTFQERPVCDHKEKTGASAIEQRREEDCVFNYHSAFLKMGLLERDFQDSMREGDGKRTSRIWKFKMLHFKEAQRHKYSLEALKLQIDIQAMQSPRVAHRMMWNRTVNVTSSVGHVTLKNVISYITIYFSQIVTELHHYKLN